jgi:hypothetical protein
LLQPRSILPVGKSSKPFICVVASNDRFSTPPLLDHLQYSIMMRLECVKTLVCFLVVLLLTTQQGLAATTGFLRDNNNKDAPSIYDCLQAASGGDECRAAFDGQCVWCAEPIYGLCVTPSVAHMIGALPFFKCDPHNSTTAVW